MFALKYPSFVKTLILNGANLYPRGVKKEVQQAIEQEYKMAKGNDKKRAYLNLMIKEPQIKASQLHNISCPTLVIVGDEDVIKASHSALIAENISNSTLVTLSGTHFIAYEQPDAFNRAVQDFLDKNA